MKKNIKYSVSVIVIILLLVLGYTAYAEDNGKGTQAPVACTMEARICPDGSYVSRIAPDCEFAKCPDESSIKDNSTGGKIKNRFDNVKSQIQVNREENKGIKEEVKNEIGNVKNELEKEREEHRIEMKGLIDQIKTKREEFKNEFELKKEEAKVKIAEIKANFKENFAKIKDENKKLTAEKIVTAINDLNSRLTGELKIKIDKIENVLVSIESRITKAKDNGIDVVAVQAEVEKAKLAIDAAKLAITGQVGKSYSVSTADDTTLKAEMKKLRDTFNEDMKAVREKVKLAHQAVKDTAVMLAKIPKIDDDTDENVVENNNTTNNQ